MGDDNQSELPRKRRKLGNDDLNTNRASSHHKTLNSSVSPPPTRRIRETAPPTSIPSPFQLTWIRDLPASSNVDAVCLKDILGDPLIAECWEFNYLHDLDYLMDAFDSDVKDLVKVHVVHGFWKEEDSSRKNLIVSAHALTTGFCSQILAATSHQVSEYHSSYGFHARNVRNPSFQGR